MARALIIDDETSLTTVIARFLRSAGFEVETATSGLEGIRKATARPPDVAIIDVMMPHMDGYEVCRRLRRDPRTSQAVIVVLTARGQPIDKEFAFRAGADAHVPKPYQGKALNEEIQRLLASRPEPTIPLGYQVLILRLQEDAGATTLATNLALRLRRDSRLVAVVDLAWESGQIENRLGLPPTRTWPAGPAGDPDRLAACLERHESGVFVLPAPPPTARRPQPAEVQEILDTLRTWHDYVVVDTPFNMSTLAPVLFSSSPLILLLLTPDASLLRTAQASLAAIQKVGLRTLQVWPVVSMMKPGQEAFQEQVEATLKLPVLTVLPWAPAECAGAVANARPVALSYPESPLARAFQPLAQRIVRTAISQPLRRIPK